ncbi:MAG: hypothetical protein H0U53_07880, partial [Actinobacteria bacterium]|nr:hypothetical protein [Actinomycetota bacterium]
MTKLWLSGLFFLSFACGAPEVDLLDQAPPTLREEPAGFEEAVVTRVVDGDTIEVEVIARVPG